MYVCMFDIHDSPMYTGLNDYANVQALEQFA
jgi:hypothetical protein